MLKNETKIVTGTRGESYKSLGTEGHALSVVASRRSDDPYLPLLRGERGHFVVCTAQLE